jgi:DNA/RNA-binding domain of Phe-tRNA-synthetase-like protein
MELSIDNNLKQILPALSLGVIAGPVRVTKHDQQLWVEIDKTIRNLTRSLTLERVPHIPQVTALREAYKSIGKDPSRYRGSQESLLRRILQGKPLYQINTIVDINNLISLGSQQSVGSYDLSRLSPPFVFRTGLPGEQYKGIGKETINLEGLPIFADQHAPFGSPTSDSERAMITLETQEIMMVIISFAGNDKIRFYLDCALDMLRKHANLSDERTRSFIVE